MDIKFEQRNNLSSLAVQYEIADPIQIDDNQVIISNSQTIFIYHLKQSQLTPIFTLDNNRGPRYLWKYKQNIYMLRNCRLTAFNISTQQKKTFHLGFSMNLEIFLAHQVIVVLWFMDNIYLHSKKDKLKNGNWNQWMWQCQRNI